MRPQVPLDRSRNRPDQTYSATQQRSKPPRKNLVKSSSQNGVDHWKLQAHEMPKSLGGIVASNYGVLNEIRDYEQFFGSVNRLDSLSVTSSFDMERAQAGHEPQGGRGTPQPPLLQENQKQLRGNPYLVASQHSSKSKDTAAPLEQFPHETIDSVNLPRTRQFSGQELEKDKKKQENVYHTNENLLGLDLLPNNALADTVATPNSASENSRLVSAFVEHNRTDAASSPKKRLPPTILEFNRPPPAFSEYKKTDFAPFRCHGVSPSAQSMPSKGSPEQLQTQGGALQGTTMSFLDIFSPANLWKSCSPAIDAQESNQTYQFNSPPRSSLHYTEENLKEEPRNVTDFISADSTRRRSRQREMIEFQERQRAYEDLMFITWSRPPTPEGRRSGGRRTQQHRRVGTPDTIGSRTRYTHSPASQSLTPEFSIRRSPTSSQIREDLWGSSAHDDLIAAEMVAPNATDSATSSIPAPDQAYPQFPASDAVDDFDPFGIGYEPQTEPPQDQLGPADATPRMSNSLPLHVYHKENHSNSFRTNSSLEPSKRDTKPKRKRSKSTGGTDSELSQTSDNPSSHSWDSIRGDNPDNISGHHTGKKEGLPNQDQHSPRIHRNALRNYEMLRKVDQGHIQIDHDGTHQHTTLKSSASSVSRKARKSEVTQLQRRKESADPSNMYVAYLRFGTNPRELLQLCKHPARPDSKPKSGEVPLKVLASSISTTDCDIRRGEWKAIRLEPYIIPGASLVGVVSGIGQKKRHGFKEGDVVLGLVTLGGNSRYASVCKDLLVKIPPELDPCVAVCLSETYLTAFQALHMGQRGSPRYRSDSLNGKSILILGGSSNLGHALIEVASAGGVEYCYALAKERHFEGIRRQGAIPLPRSPDQWLTLIGRQIHMLVVVADSNGLYTDNVTPDHFKAVCEDGQVIFIGPPGVDPKVAENNTAWGRSSPSLSSPNPSRLICKSIKGSMVERSSFYNLFDSWGFDPKLGRRDLEHLVTLLESGRIRPTVLERVPLSKVARVHSILETMKVPGFIVCAPWINEPPYSQQLLGAHTLSASTATSGETFAV